MRMVMPVTMTHRNVRPILARMVLDMATRPNRLVGSTYSRTHNLAIPVETLAPTPLAGILAASRRPSLNRILASPPAASRVCLTSSKVRIAGYMALRGPWLLDTGNLPSSLLVAWAPGTI